MTEALFKYLTAKRESLKEDWASGRLQGVTTEVTMMNNAMAHGMAQTIQEILDLQSADLRGNDE